ncbi:hypothetical protein BH23BAC3_BH23BAC3_07080 [soil metagenome]
MSLNHPPAILQTMARKISKSEQSILRELIFIEPFSHLLEETGISYGALRDDLINLINHGYIEVFSMDGRQSVSPFYDSDKIDQFSFQATKSGLKSIQNYAV